MKISDPLTRVKSRSALSSVCGHGRALEKACPPRKKDNASRMFQTALRSFRKKLGVSRRELASRIGVSESSVKGWESLRCLPTRENLDRLAAELRLSRDDRELLDYSFKKMSDSRFKSPLRGLSHRGLKYVRHKPTVPPEKKREDTRMRVLHHRDRRYLFARGLVDENGALTEKGRSLKEKCEANWPVNMTQREILVLTRYKQKENKNDGRRPDAGERS